MKSGWFLLTLTGVVLVSSPAKANTLESSPTNESSTTVNAKSSETIAGNNSFQQLPALPRIQFIPPAPSNISPVPSYTSPNPSDRSLFAGIHLGKELSGLNSQIHTLMNRVH